MTENYENKKNKYITLGNLAKLANIGRDTLSFYSRKGLIRPVYVGDNGYKYFLPEQVQTIHFIRFYRRLDFPLETIQNMLDSSEKEEHTDQDQTAAFERQLAYLQRKIEDFRTAAAFLETEKNFHLYISSHRNDSVFFSQLEEKNFYQTPIRFCHSLNQAENAQKISDFFCRGGSFQIPEYPICCVIPRQALLEGHFCAYVRQENMAEISGCGKMPADEASQTDGQNDDAYRHTTSSYSCENGIVTRSAGTYACFIHTGGTGSIFPSIRRILDELGQSGIKITGDAYVINSYHFLNVTEFQHSDYIIQIRVEDLPQE